MLASHFSNLLGPSPHIGTHMETPSCGITSWKPASHASAHQPSMNSFCWRSMPSRVMNGQSQGIAPHFWGTFYVIWSYTLLIANLFVCQLFKNVMLKVSKDNIPLVQQVIPIINYLHQCLEDFTDDPSKSMIVHHAAQNGVWVLDKYYSQTDESVMYHVAMGEAHPYHSMIFTKNNFAVLHPKYKTTYFKTKGWAPSWIEEAVCLIRKIWEDKYKSRLPMSATAATTVCP